MATTKIKIKQSSVTGNIPTASQLDQGELALNTADRKFYSKDSSGVVFEIGATSTTSIFLMDGGSSLDGNDGNYADIIFDLT